MLKYRLTKITKIFEEGGTPFLKYRYLYWIGYITLHWIKEESLMLQCAVVEDVDLDAQKLVQALQTAAVGKCELNCRLFPSGDALLKSPSPAGYDAVFLDICMPGIDGVETARQLREMSPLLPIVFITSSGDYIWQALSSHPFDYLLKPFDQRSITKLLEDLLRTLRRVEREIEVRVERKTFFVPLRKIHCITAQNHVVNVLTDKGEYRAALNFSQLQAELCQDPRFLACNRGVVVNMDKVLRFEGDTIEMLCGKTFPVRQRDKGQLFAAFTQYQFRRMRKEV